MANFNKNKNHKHCTLPDTDFPIIPFIHMVYAGISCERNTTHLDLEYENGKKRKVSIY